jgi:uncharacterized protein YdbL (DUF1318 family)
MATQTVKNEVWVGNDQTRTKLEGVELENYLIQRKKDDAEAALIQAQIEAKAAARKTIAERLGLTADELQVLLG